MFKHDHLSPLILQTVGLLLLVGFVVFWAVTGQESALLVGAALSLIATGSASGAFLTVRQEIVASQHSKRQGEIERLVQEGADEERKT